MQQLHEDEEVIRKLLSGIEIIPGSGEYVLNQQSAYGHLTGKAEDAENNNANLW